MKIKRSQIKKMIIRLLTEDVDVSNINTRNIKNDAAALAEYSDVIGDSDYAVIELVEDGINSELASNLVAGTRIGDYGEQKLLAMAKAGISPAGIAGFAHQSSADTNNWVDPALYLSPTPRAVGSEGVGRPGGGADSVGADLWIPTTAGWRARANASRGVLNLTLCGAAYSMKMSAATTQAGDETIQETKFVKEDGVVDVGYLLIYKWLKENDKLTGADVSKLTSKRDFKSEINRLLDTFGINIVRYYGGAANGSVAKSTEITDSIQKSIKVDLTGLSGKITYGSIAAILNKLVDAVSMSENFESKPNNQAKIQFLKGHYNIDLFYSHLGANISYFSSTGSRGRINYLATKDPGGQCDKFYNDFWPAAETFLDAFAAENIDPTLAISFRSTVPIEYVLEMSTSGLRYRSGQMIGATKSSLPNEDNLVILGKYRDRALPFIRSMSTAFTSMAGIGAQEEQAQSQRDFNIVHSQDPGAAIAGDRMIVGMQQPGSPGAAFDAADRMAQLVASNIEFKKDIEAIIKGSVASISNFKQGRESALKTQFSSAFALGPGAIDKIWQTDYPELLKASIEAYLTAMHAEIENAGRETGSGFGRNTNVRKGYEQVWSNAFRDLATITTVDTTEIRQKMLDIKDIIDSGRMVGESLLREFRDMNQYLLSVFGSNASSLLEKIYTFQTLYSMTVNLDEGIQSTLGIDTSRILGKFLQSALGILSPLAPEPVKFNTPSREIDVLSLDTLDDLGTASDERELAVVQEAIIRTLLGFAK